MASLYDQVPTPEGERIIALWEKLSAARLKKPAENAAYQELQTLITHETRHCAERVRWLPREQALELLMEVDYLRAPWAESHRRAGRRSRHSSWAV